MTANSNIVKLNIGGTVFQTTKSTLTRFDGFFKTILETDVPVAKDESGVIFTDRDPKHFRLILNFMRDGHVAIPKSEEDIQEIKTEAQYYLLDDLVELCKTKKSGTVVKKELRYLTTVEQMNDAFLDSRKKGVIVVYYPKDNNLNFSFPMAKIAKKYSDEFDVYFTKSVFHINRLNFKARRKEDGESFFFDCYHNISEFYAKIEAWFPTEE